jgi:hypothetical protein
MATDVRARRLSLNSIGCGCFLSLFVLVGVAAAAPDTPKTPAEIRAEIERKRAEIERKRAEMEQRRLERERKRAETKTSKASPKAEEESPIALLNLVPGPDNPSGGPRQYTATDGTFKFHMAGTPNKQTLKVAGVAMTMFMTEEPSGAFAVAVADMPIPAGESADKIETRLDGAREGMLRNINAKLTAEYKTALNRKYPGREIRADLPQKVGIVRARIYIVNKRCYQVMVIGFPSLVNSTDSTKFLDSLTVTP